MIRDFKPWQVAGIFIVIGVAVFFSGLNNPFQGDDSYQIVNNPPVHSIKNIGLFFQSSTFYNGEKLTGVYYRPMMATVDSFIYTLFGPSPVAFHIVQLALYIASAFLLYLVFKHFFRQLLALALALIFLVHPLNSQVVYSIPTMQDALFFFFGISAVWVLIHRSSVRSLWAVAGLLLLAMLSKEAGFVFVIMALLYVIWFDRKRLRIFACIALAPIIIYLALKVHAVGIFGTQHAAPIDEVSLADRLLTAPSVALFYLMKFVFPQSLATGYYWVDTKFDFWHVLVPLIIDIAIIGSFTYAGIWLRNKVSKAKFRAYLFFAAWAVLGTILYLQVVPLDMTACETWFYFAMAGLLGMIGVLLQTIRIHIQPVWLLSVVVVLVGILGVRTALRGVDYSSQYALAAHDAAVSDKNYSALGNISQYLIDHGEYKKAAVYAQRSIDIYPVVSNYINLGVALEQSGDYPGAIEAYKHALKYGDLNIIYENLGLILLVYSDPVSTNQFFEKALKTYPHDHKLWLYAAILDGATGDTSKAKEAIKNAVKYGPVPQLIYLGILNDQPFTLPLLGKVVLVR